MKKGDHLKLRKVGKGIQITNDELKWFLLGNMGHLEEFIAGEKAFVDMTVIVKE